MEASFLLHHYGEKKTEVYDQCHLGFIEAYGRLDKDEL